MQSSAILNRLCFVHQFAHAIRYDRKYSTATIYKDFFLIRSYQFPKIDD
jgi:hypothetical protein